MKQFYTGIDGFLIRTCTYTTARVWSFLYFYDWINPDPRRVARPDWMVEAGLAGGALAGLITNPIEIVYTRMQADELYPEGFRRNYSSFYDGMIKTWQEGSLFRGAVPNALKLGALCAGMTSIYDWCKESSYWFLGPHWLNRLWAAAAATAVGTVVSMPFDTIRVMMHTMRPLPNGQYPYHSLIDCFYKIMKYQGDVHRHGNFSAFYPGALNYFLRLFLISYVSILLLDVYHGQKHVPEFWAPSRYTAPTGIDFDIHDPFTMVFHKSVVAYHNEGSAHTKAYTSDHSIVKNA